MDKILIVYATWTGATRQVAQAIGDVLQDEMTKVDVCRAREAEDPTSYQAVIVGTSVHMGRLPREIVRFVKRHQEALGQMPVAYFCVCLAMAEDTDESHHTAAGYLEKLCTIAPEVEPVDKGLFAGAVLADTPEFRRLFPLFKIPVTAMAEQPDHRDWEAIRAWATGLKPKLSSANTN